MYDCLSVAFCYTEHGTLCSLLAGMPKTAQSPHTLGWSAISKWQQQGRGAPSSPSAQGSCQISRTSALDWSAAGRSSHAAVLLMAVACLASPRWCCGRWQVLPGYCNAMTIQSLSDRARRYAHICTGAYAHMHRRERQRGDRKGEALDICSCNENYKLYIT